MTTSHERLDHLFSISTLANKSSDKVLIDGLLSIDGEEYENITKYQSWLRTVILMVENIPISVSIVKADTFQHLVYVNKAFETLTHFRREEVIGKNCRFLQGDEPSPHERTTRDTLRHTIQNNHNCKVLITNYKKNGTKFRNLLMIFPIRTIDGITRF